MSRHGHNTDCPDSGPAIEAALEGLDRAIGATLWMETLAVPDGGNPELEDQERPTGQGRPIPCSHTYSGRSRKDPNA